MKKSTTASWQALTEHAEDINNMSAVDLLADPARETHFCVSTEGCYFDFSKQIATRETLDLLHRLSVASELSVRRDEMLAGVQINHSEQRSVLHTALRGGADANQNRDTEIAHTLARMSVLADGVRTGKQRGYRGHSFTDIVHIGTGGSHLGPELAVTALDEYKRIGLRIHFVANIDANALQSILATVQPETTLFIIASKSFTTLETVVNAQSARSWFLERTQSIDAIKDHFVAITTNLEAAGTFGLPEENLFPIWDWVGGRYSIWSAIGLPVMIAIGSQEFANFLAGARYSDEQFRSQPFQSNSAMLLASYGIWNTNFRDASSHAVLCYDERLRLLPNYLQQLEMESNGKSVDVDGEPISVSTAQILWGGTGTQGQHAYHQLLHQGTQRYSADFVVVANNGLGNGNHQQWLHANALAQSEAMAVGNNEANIEPQRRISGGHSTTTIVLDRLTPRNLGALLATYEHKVFCQGAIWNINSFDQWGVELGKTLAEPIFASLSDASRADTSLSPATRNLIAHIKKTSC